MYPRRGEGTIQLKSLGKRVISDREFLGVAPRKGREPLTDKSTKKFGGLRKFQSLKKILTLVHVKHCSVQAGLVQAQNIALESNDTEQSDLEIKQQKKSLN